MSKNSKLKSPYPYFGGKGRVADIVWSGFGKVNNYVEPFCGSLAVLLANPSPAKIETVNDIDHFIVNFWRAVSNNPEGVAKYADYPVQEAELHARHKWLISAITEDFKTKINSDPDFYDLKIAGWWIWGIGASIGNNWLQSKGLNAMPLLSSAGGGIHGLTFTVIEWFKSLQERTRRVRVCCSDWSKMVTPSITFKNKGLGVNDITGVFLDPPYDTENREIVYAQDNNIFNDVCKWAIDNGNNEKLRIVLCGYEGGMQMPDDWKVFAWKTNGGLANKGDDQGRENSNRERIWFSPHCLDIADMMKK
jgi:hypothetical protein